MSTSSERARRAADAAKGKKPQSPSGKHAGAEGPATLEERLAAAEAVAAEAAVAAAQAAEAAKAAVAAAAALRKEVKLEAEGFVGSPSPERRRRVSPSPECRRGRSPIVQVYRDPGGGWPQLTHANYHDWSLLMKVKLQARGLWDAVRYVNVDYDEDRRTLEALCAAVPPEVGASITNKPTAKHVSEAIATRRVGGERVQRATL